jgi:hypothetical protein
MRRKGGKVLIRKSVLLRALHDEVEIPIIRLEGCIHGRLIGHVGGGADGPSIRYGPDFEIVHALVAFAAALAAVERVDFVRRNVIQDAVDARSSEVTSMALPEPSTLFLLKARL